MDFEKLGSTISSLLGFMAVATTAFIAYFKVLRPSRKANGRLENVETTLALWESRVDVLESTLAATQQELKELKKANEECEDERGKLRLELLGALRSKGGDK